MIGTIWIVVGAAFAASCIWLTVRIVNRRERWAKWTAVALVLAPVLYVVSSGPMKAAVYWRHVTHESTTLSDGTTGVVSTSEHCYGKWFPIAYAPLLSATEQPWGEPVKWYWSLFPYRSTRGLP
jgi:hypothetical protein